LNLVIDASVLIKFYLPEILADRAERLLARVERGEVTLCAPDLIYPEVGNILWKKERLKELSRSEVGAITEAIGVLPITVEGSKPLLPLAVEIGVRYGITVYDAMYVSIAKVYEIALVTADRKLVDRMAKGDFKESLLWLGHYEE
jgi:predicted nucleic acid-binding protein